MPRHTYDVVLNGHVLAGVTSEAEYNFLSDLPIPEVVFDPGWSVRTGAIQAIHRRASRNDDPMRRRATPTGDDAPAPATMAPVDALRRLP